MTNNQSQPDNYTTVSDFSDTPLYGLASRLKPIIILGILTLVLFIAVPLIVSRIQIIPASDNAYYLVVAKSLSQGSGLRMLSNPALPLTTLAPPAYPLFLSGFLGLFGLESPVPYRLLSVVFWFGTIVMVGFLVRREDGQAWGVFIAFLTALNIYLLEYATEILTELPYMFLTSVVIFCGYKYVDRLSSRRWLWLAGSLIGLVGVLHLRMIGLSLLAAIILFLLVRQKFLAAIVIGVVVTLSYLPWISFWASQNGLTLSVFNDWFSTNTPFDLDAEPQPASSVITERITYNGLYYLSTSRRNLLGWSYFESISSPAIYNILGVLVIIPIGIGWWIKLRSAETALIPLYIALYPIVLLLIVSKAVARYWLPLAPFFTWYFLIGVATVIALSGSRLGLNLRRQRLVFFAINATLVCLLLSSALLTIITRLPVLLGKQPQDPPEKHSYWQAADWIKEHTSPDSIVLSRELDGLFLRSGRQTVRYPFTTNQDKMMNYLFEHNISYIVADHLNISDEDRDEFLLPFLNNQAEAVEEVYRSPDDLTVVYHFRPELAKR